VFRDRDPETGKRVLHMSAGKKERSELGKVGIYPMHTESIRIIWEKAANRHLEMAGYKDRIDCRSLEAQGAGRDATVHEGAQAHKLAREGKRPESKVVEFPNAATAKSKERLVDYIKIDNGRTRQEYNRLVRQGNTSLIKELGNNAALGNHGVDGNRKPPEIISQSGRRNSGSRSRESSLGRSDSAIYKSSRTQHSRQQRKRFEHIIISDGKRSNDNRMSETERFGNSAYRENNEDTCYNRGWIVFQRNRLIKDRNMSDDKRLDALLSRCENKQEELETLKFHNTESERNILRNVREYQNGQKSDEQTKADYEANANMKRLTEDKLKETEAGRDYLYGQEFHDMRESLHQEDAEARQKIADTKKVSEMEARTEANPQQKAAQVAENEVSQTDAERKTAELMAFLASEDAPKPEIKLQKAAELEDEKEKQQGKNLGDDYGMG